ncbi:hypothetical protein BV898_13567 [Hypsibius exemplaris]|uniref:Uncharacterized protein n=1 Tax=Hypsibius exemplaris TaxID=2072580 RepID=A0A1W0WAE7_HYPEX|nr:hypothetical protein BV898_13567 [Hypsibius exemplaris]
MAALSFLAWMLILIWQASSTESAVIVPQTAYWPTNPDALQVGDTWTSPKVIIGYRKEPGYTGEDWDLIRTGMRTINTATKNCIRFDERRVSQSGLVSIFQTKTDQGVDATVCKARLGNANPDPVRDQLVYAFKADPTSRQNLGECLSEPRDTLRLLMNIIGFGNEYQRSDRSPSLIFSPNFNNLVPTALQSENLLAVQTGLEINSNFDVDSITMIKGDRYASNLSEPLFRFRNGVPASLSDIQLSRSDCYALNYMYGCDLICSSAEFVQPTPTVPPPPACPIATERIQVNLNCWSSQQENETLTAAEYALDIGVLRMLQPFVPGCSQLQPPDATLAATWTLNGETDLITLRPDATYENIKVALAKKISKGFQTTVKVQVTDSDLNTIIQSKDIVVSVNCLPRFSAPCKNSSTEGNCSLDQYEGKRDVTHVLAETPNLAIGVCDAGIVQPGLTLSSFEAHDPDGSKPALSNIAVTTTEDGVPTMDAEVSRRSWHWSPLSVDDRLSVRLFYTGKPLKAPVKLQVFLSVADAEVSAGVLLWASYTIQCDPAAKRPVLVPAETI